MKSMTRLGHWKRGISLPSTARMCSSLPHENVIILHFQEKFSLFSFLWWKIPKTLIENFVGISKNAYLEFEVRIWIANRTNEVVLCLHPAMAAILPDLYVFRHFVYESRHCCNLGSHCFRHSWFLI